MNNAHWELHFRNFDRTLVQFHTHHWGCVGIPWGDGRARCNTLTVPYNPTGGHNSVYVPANWIVGSMRWATLILDAMAGEISVSIVDETESLSSSISDSVKVEEIVLKKALADTGKSLETLTKDAIAAFAASCRAVNKTPDQVRAIAAQMGLPVRGFTFIAGEAYQKYIRDDNRETNENAGFSIFAYANNIDRIAQAAFIHQGFLYFYFNSNDLTGFWKVP